MYWNFSCPLVRCFYKCLLRVERDTLYSEVACLNVNLLLNTFSAAAVTASGFGSVLLTFVLLRVIWTENKIIETLASVPWDMSQGTTVELF